MKRKVVVTDGLVMLYQVLLSNSFSASSLRLRKLIKNDNQENTVNCFECFLWDSKFSSLFATLCCQMGIKKLLSWIGLRIIINKFMLHFFLELNTSKSKVSICGTFVLWIPTRRLLIRLISFNLSSHSDHNENRWWYKLWKWGKGLPRCLLIQIHEVYSLWHKV